MRKAGFRVGIVSDSFDTATEVVRRRVFADFSFANLMGFRNGLATGRVTLAPVMSHAQGCKVHAHCKANVMFHLLEHMGIGPETVLAVGDGENDVCMLRQAGCSVAFQPSTPRVREAARHMLRGTLAGVLALVQHHLSARLEPLAVLTPVPDPSCP